MDLPHTEKSLTISLVIFDTIHECDQTDGHTKTAIALCTASNSKNQQNKKKVSTEQCVEKHTTAVYPVLLDNGRYNFSTSTSNLQHNTCQLHNNNN